MVEIWKVLGENAKSEASRVRNRTTHDFELSSALDASRRYLSNAPSPVSLRPSVFEIAGGCFRPLYLPSFSTYPGGGR